jgi:plastocyanin
MQHTRAGARLARSRRRATVSRSFIRLKTTGWIALTALVAGGGSECSNSMGPSLAAHDVTIVQGAQTMGSNAFSPNPFTVSLAAGGRVIWGNADFTSGSYGNTGTTHTVTSDNAVWDSGDVGPAQTYAFTFTSVGTYNYHCSHHPTMVGTITVTP